MATFDDLKLGKIYKYIIYGINDDKTKIVPMKTSKSDNYEEFLSDLPEDDCRYAIYDFEYETASGEGKRSKIAFFFWAPDTAPVKSKMIYASSKDAIRRALNGVSTEIQGTDYSEVAYEIVLEKASRGAGSH